MNDIRSTKGSSLDVVVAQSFEDTGLTRDAWDAFVLETGAGLYMSHDWCSIWWKHYGGKRRLRIFVVREGDRLVGLVPMFVDTVWLGPVWLRLAKRVGSDHVQTVFQLPIRADHAATVYRAVIDMLLAKDRCDAIWFGLMTGTDQTIEGLRLAASGMDGAAILRDRVAGVHTTYNLPATFEDYLGGLDRQQRYNYKRRDKQLAAEHKVEVTVVSDPKDAVASYEDFKRIHEAQWTSEGRLGHFDDWPGADAYNRELVEQLSNLGRYGLMKITADGVLCGAKYFFNFGDESCSRLPARAVGEQWSRYGLGVMVHVKYVEQMIAAGLRRLELGVGHYDYKMKLGGDVHDARSMLLVRKSPLVMLRARAFMKLAEALHFAYYRVWFLKLSPRFPALRGPLWRIWIRSNLL